MATQPDPRDHVPAELRQERGGLANLLDMFVTVAPEVAESELDLLAEAMRTQAMGLRLIDSMPKVRDLLLRGADAIDALQKDLDKAEIAISNLEMLVEGEPGRD